MKMKMETKSLSNYRTMNYVEVIYLQKGQYQSRKKVDYLEKEAAVMFLRTVNKFKEEKKNALICLRDEAHQLLKVEICLALL